MNILCNRWLELRIGASVDIPDQNCFVGFDAYKRIIESDVDIIIEASIAHFQPRHFETAVQAEKRVFI